MSQETEFNDFNDFFSDSSSTSQGEKKNVNYFKIKDGDGDQNTYRIAPAFGDLKASNKWATYYKVHYGYDVIDSRAKNGKRVKPFLCIQNIKFDTKEVLQACPECDAIQKNSSLLDQRRKEYAANMSAEQLEAAVGSLVDWKKSHNLDKKWWVVAKNTKGDWGYLQIPNTAYQALRETMDKLQKEDGIDALSPKNGVWFEFSRSGKALNTKYSISVVTERVTVNGQQLKSIKTAPLTAKDVDVLKSMTALDKIYANKILNFDQIQSLVTSHGDPQVVASVWGVPTTTAKVTNAVTKEQVQASIQQAVNNSAKTVTPPSGNPAAIKLTSEMTPEEFDRMFT